MQMRSSLKERTGPGWELAEYPSMTPWDLPDTFAFSIRQGWFWFCVWVSSRVFVLATIGSGCNLGCDFCYAFYKCFLCMRPDLERWCCASMALVLRMALSRWMALLSMSTRETEMMDLGTRVLLLRVGRFLSAPHLEPFRLSLYIISSLKHTLITQPTSYYP